MPAARKYSGVAVRHSATGFGFPGSCAWASALSSSCDAGGAERDVPADADLGHARQRGEPPLSPPAAPDAWAGVRSPSSGTSIVSVFSMPDAGVHRIEPEQRPRQQPRGGKHRDGSRHLRHDEPALDPLARAGRSGAGAGERRRRPPPAPAAKARRRTAAPTRWPPPTANASTPPSIRISDAARRESLGEADQQVEAEISEAQPEAGAECGEDRGSRSAAAGGAGPVGAQGPADRQLALAPHPPGEHQVGDVGARGEEHQRRGRQ